MEQVIKDKSVQHLAGIVPVAGQPLDFNMPWHDSLIPIAQNYLAVERSVFQCVLAGCETVWIVGHVGTQPLIRKRIGDIIVDPVGLSINPASYKRVKEVSIYYVPIHPKDRDKRDCLGWSVLYAADSAYRISKFISKWIAPERFFCSFPYGIVSDESLRENRLLFSSDKKALFSYNKNTVKNNLHLPFTFDAQDFFRCRDIVKHKQAEEWGNKSARFYDLATVFKGLDTDASQMIELPWFHDISSWEGYRNYLSSEQSKLYTKPVTLFKGNRRRYDDRSSRKDLQQDSVASETGTQFTT
jgi:hypothetical protein